jgi:hypothetical protein
MEVSADQLKRAIESQHGGTAVFVDALPVKEVWQGKTVWEGVVHVSDLEDHPKATRAYAWSSPVEGAGSTPCCTWAAYGRRSTLYARP